MMTRSRFGSTVLFLVLGVLAPDLRAHAQGGRQEPGKTLGKISVQGNLIVMTLDEGVLGKPSLFDLTHHTLRFTPDGSGYRAENVAWHWDSDFGTAMTDSQATLKCFSFPFSGKTWNSFTVGITGSMTFGEQASGRPG